MNTTFTSYQEFQLHFLPGKSALAPFSKGVKGGKQGEVMDGTDKRLCPW
jgi:hypothetical protein